MFQLINIKIEINLICYIKLIMNPCWSSCIDFVFKKVLIQPPLTPPPLSDKKKINWIIGEEPLKLK